MNTTILIPARYSSSRFPGKPLAKLEGPDGVKFLIQRTWEIAMSVPEASNVYIATDDDRIAKTAREFGAEVIMTDVQCKNGTERCAEAVKKLDITPDLVVNLQGDAPLTPVEFLSQLILSMKDDIRADVATPVLRCDQEALKMLLQDRANGQVGGTTVVFDEEMQALYFSKEVIPYFENNILALSLIPVFHHVGVYAYRPSALAQYISWPEGKLEKLEGLEQLRFIENGARVKCVEAKANGRAFWELNNPEDVARIELILKQSEIL